MGYEYGYVPENGAEVLEADEVWLDRDGALWVGGRPEYSWANGAVRVTVTKQEQEQEQEPLKPKVGDVVTHLGIPGSTGVLTEVSSDHVRPGGDARVTWLNGFHGTGPFSVRTAYNSLRVVDAVDQGA